MVGQWGMIFFLQQNIQSMTASDIVLWAGVEFAISGYMLNHIQKEKRWWMTNHLKINFFSRTFV
jgi:hypothetical protein